MSRVRKLTVFLSYSFDSQKRGRSEILSVVERAAEIATNSLKNVQPRVQLVIEAELTSYGSLLPVEITMRLKHADIAIIDVSDPSPNVYYELGFLAALSKHRIIIAARSEAGLPRLPSDIEGTLVLSYESIDSVVGRLAERLKQSALDVLRTTARDIAMCQDVWGNLHNDHRPIVILGPRSSSVTDFMDITSRNFMFLDNLGDKDSIFELSLMMARLFPECALVRYVSDQFPRDAYDHNLIVVGGPGVPGSQGNRLVNTLQKRLGIDVRYSEDATKMITPEGEELAAEFNDGRCTLDYGFFAKAHNPFNPSARVFMCHGIYTMGTLGAARLLSDHPAAQENISTVIDELGAEADFWCTFAVQVINGVPMIPAIDMSRVFLL